MASRWVTELALDVLEESFGPSVRSVADALVALGPSSGNEVSRYVATTPGFAGANSSIWTRVRAALLVLQAIDALEISLDVDAETKRPVAATSPGGRSSMGVGTLRYEFAPLAALRVLRQPHYLYEVNDAYGAAGTALAQALLQLGPWTRSATLEAATRLLAVAEGSSGAPAAAPAPARPSKWHFPQGRAANSGSSLPPPHWRKAARGPHGAAERHVGRAGWRGADCAA